MKLALAALGTSFVLAGCAAGPKEQDHAAHHPPGTAAAGPAAPTPGQMDSMMKSMQEMHDRMMAAKTPEDRSRLMQEHMKLMQEGMSMMGGMAPGKAPANTAARQQMMEKRMDMMQSMMQMMMDRMPMSPVPPGK